MDPLRFDALPEWRRRSRKCTPPTRFRPTAKAGTRVRLQRFPRRSPIWARREPLPTFRPPTTGWSPPLTFSPSATNFDQAVCILFRMQTVGLGTTAGYVLNYNVTDGAFRLNGIAGEAAVNPTLAESDLKLDPTAHTYRFVLSTYADNLLGQIFQLPDTNNPIFSRRLPDQAPSRRARLACWSLTAMTSAPTRAPTPPLTIIAR